MLSARAVVKPLHHTTHQGQRDTPIQKRQHFDISWRSPTAPPAHQKSRRPCARRNRLWIWSICMWSAMATAKWCRWPKASVRYPCKHLPTRICQTLDHHTELSLHDRIRRTLILGPIVVFGYTLLVKMAILNGWAGWYYTFQRTLAEIMLSLRLIEKKICKASCIAQKDTRSTANRATHK